MKHVALKHSMFVAVLLEHPLLALYDCWSKPDQAYLSSFAVLMPTRWKTFAWAAIVPCFLQVSGAGRGWHSRVSSKIAHRHMVHGMSFGFQDMFVLTVATEAHQPMRRWLSAVKQQMWPILSHSQKYDIC